ncbi:hypothetical protein LINGRAHAP2_LOCUS5088, partial [Linum grandiflorum]
MEHHQGSREQVEKLRMLSFKEIEGASAKLFE